MTYFLLSLLFLALASLGFLGGGALVLFALPAYSLLAALGILSVVQWRRSGKHVDKLCLGSAALFFAYVILRTMLSPVPYLAREDWFLAAGALVVYGILSFNLTEAKVRLLLVAGLLGLGVLHSIVGLIQAVGGNAAAWMERFNSFYGTRASGFYACPNHLAGFLELIVLFGLSVVVWSKWNYLTKVLAAYASLVCLAGLVMTGSRGGYLSFTCGLVVFGLLSALASGRRLFFARWPTVLSGLMLAGFIAAGVAYLGAQNVVLAERWHRLIETNDVRLALWQGAVNQFTLSPIIGTGAGTYLYYGRLFRPPQISADPVVAHNDYLQLLAEFGIIGLIAFLVFLVCHVRSGWRTFRGLTRDVLVDKNRPRSNTLALNIGALSALAAYAVHSGLDFNLHIPANALLMAAAMGVMATGIRRADAQPLQWPALALPALGLWLALAIVPGFPAEYYCYKARNAAASEHYRHAIRLAKAGLRYDSKNPALYRYLGEACLSLGQQSRDRTAAAPLFAAAAEALRKAVALFPQDRDLLAMLGESLDESGQYGEAEQVFQNALAWDPNSHQMRFYYAQHLYKAGKTAAAAAKYKESLDLQWNWAAYWGLQEIKQKQSRE